MSSSAITTAINETYEDSREVSSGESLADMDVVICAGGQTSPQTCGEEVLGSILPICRQCSAFLPVNTYSENIDLCATCYDEMRSTMDAIPDAHRETPRSRENIDSCGVCRNEAPVNMDIIPCAHRKAFCEPCVEKVLFGDDVTCPLCRAPWPIVCPVCRVEPSTYNDGIPCAHQENFCGTCVEKLHAGDNIKCPLCRAPWAVNTDIENIDLDEVILDELRINMDIIPDDYRETPWPVNIDIENIDQHLMIAVNEGYTMEHHSSPPIATGGLMHNVLTCCAIGLLIGFIIYPTMKEI
ncbi:unnamed protein product [Adineta steineri]|uniref:RING-type domain-containing protein n=1 Tax=Adineta steineri TaxID=433720 RepID=A0A815DWA0_9BILA|nr:unnamed protein product [Adineta steineri]CAF1298921.1 unnamed protein product [Adineta steineri]